MKRFLPFLIIVWLTGITLGAQYPAVSSEEPDRWKIEKYKWAELLRTWLYIGHNADGTHDPNLIATAFQINVKDPPYNAIPNDANYAAANLTAFNNALAAGYDIFVPSGTWYVNNTIIMPNFRRMRGSQYLKSIIRLTTAAGVGVDVIQMKQYNTLEDLCIYGNWDGSTPDTEGIGILIQDTTTGYAYNHLLRNVNVTNCRKYGIYAEEIAYSKFDKVYSTANGNDAVYLYGADENNACTTTDIESCVFSSSFASSASSYGLRVTNNVNCKYSFKSEGTKGVCVTGAHNRGLRFIDCYLESPNQSITCNFDLSGGSGIGCIIENCWLGMTASTAAIKTSATWYAGQVKGSLNLTGVELIDGNDEYWLRENQDENQANVKTYAAEIDGRLDVNDVNAVYLGVRGSNISNATWNAVRHNRPNAVIAVYDLAYTSSTSNTIGTGSKTWTIETGKSLNTGESLHIEVTGDNTKYMRGTITSYNSTTGELVMNITSSTGSGTYTDWSIWWGEYALLVFQYGGNAGGGGGPGGIFYGQSAATGRGPGQDVVAIYAGNGTIPVFVALGDGSIGYGTESPDQRQHAVGADGGPTSGFRATESLTEARGITLYPHSDGYSMLGSYDWDEVEYYPLRIFGLPILFYGGDIGIDKSGAFTPDSQADFTYLDIRGTLSGIVQVGDTAGDKKLAMYMDGDGGHLLTKTNYPLNLGVNGNDKITLNNSVLNVSVDVNVPASDDFRITGARAIDPNAYSSAWNGSAVAPDRNAVYDWGHTFDTDDDGLPNAAEARLSNLNQEWTANIFNPSSIYDLDPNHVMAVFDPNTSAALKITRIQITCSTDPTTEFNWDLYYADTEKGGSETLIAAVDTVAGKFDSGAVSYSVPANKAIYLKAAAAVDADLPRVTPKITWDYD